MSEENEVHEEPKEKESEKVTVITNGEVQEDVEHTSGDFHNPGSPVAKPIGLHK